MGNPHLYLLPTNPVLSGTQISYCLKVPQRGKASDLSMLHHSNPGHGCLDQVQVPNQSSSPVFFRLDLEEL